MGEFLHNGDRLVNSIHQDALVEEDQCMVAKCAEDSPIQSVR